MSDKKEGGSASAAPAAVVELPTKITSQGVHKMSTYELRQELVRRNCLDIPDDEINHNTMLKRLIVELVKDESMIVEQHTLDVVHKAQEERDIAKALRELKKAEALARSKARQADANYFATKKDANVKPVVTQIETPTVVDEEEEDVEIDNNSKNDIDDPFRTYKNNGRAKIAGFF